MFVWAESLQITNRRVAAKRRDEIRIGICSDERDHVLVALDSSFKGVPIGHSKNLHRPGVPWQTIEFFFIGPQLGPSLGDGGETGLMALRSARG